MKKNGILLLIALLALGLAGCDRLAAVGAQAAPTRTPEIPVVQDSGGVIAEGNVVPRDSARIYTRTGGEVEEVLVKEGSIVEAGAVILRLGDREAKEAALAAAQLEEQAAQKALDDLKRKAEVSASAALVALRQAEKDLVEARQALDDFDSDEYQTELDNLRKDVNTAKEDLDDAQEEFDKYKDMDPDNADRKRTEDLLEDAQKKYDDAVRKLDLKINELEQLKARVAAAEAQRDDAQSEYDRRKDGPEASELAVAEARLKSAQAQVRAAQDAMADLELKAPFAGVITSLDVGVGEIVLPNQPVAQIADLGVWYIETNDLTEMEVVKISVGQAAVIVPDALEELSLPATVETIDQEAGKKGGDVTYTVRLKLDKTDPRLRWGMTVEVRFEE